MHITGKVVAVRGEAALSLRDLYDMTESRAWKVHQARLGILLEAAVKACETSADAVAWRKAQGSVEALRRVEQIAPILEMELEAAARHSD
jgi:hypothetical protein